MRDEIAGRDCKHGQLARTCGICELEREIAELVELIAVNCDPFDASPEHSKIITRCYKEWEALEVKE